MPVNSLTNYERKWHNERKMKEKNTKHTRSKQNGVQLTLLGLRGGGPSLSVEIPIAARIWAISFVFMPQLLATFFWHRLCTFIVQAATKWHNNCILNATANLRTHNFTLAARFSEVKGPKSEINCLSLNNYHTYISTELPDEAHTYTPVPAPHSTPLYFMTAYARGGHNTACTQHWHGWHKLPVKM
jgi:hypothetical protein